MVQHCVRFGQQGHPVGNDVRLSGSVAHPHALSICRAQCLYWTGLERHQCASSPSVQGRVQSADDEMLRALRRVVLPAPLAPMSNVRLPGCRLTLMSRTTGAEPG